MEPARPFAALHEGAWLQLRGENRAAEAIYRSIVSEPAASYARRQLELLYRAEHRWVDALAVVEEHARAHPTNAEIRFQLAVSLLGLGRYAEGWPLYESRKGLPGRTAGALPLPEWTGQSVSSLIVLDEQGFGDTIQFARYLPLIRGADVTLVCRPELVSLMSTLGVRVLPRGGPIPRADAWCFTASLPGIFGTTLATIPAPHAYLTPPNEARERWRESFPAGARVGVVTRGNPTHTNDANRSLPPEAAAVVQTIQGAVSLELGGPLGLRDFADTAAVVERLKLVVTVDTAVAHLAGALGKRCLLLLPYVPEWRWLYGRPDSPWYPSLRLYRQQAPGDWASAIGPLLDEVRAGAG